jgi:hypothetical protein
MNILRLDRAQSTSGEGLRGHHRPLGARNAATVIAEQLFDGEAEAITRKVIELAKQGDLTALRLYAVPRGSVRLGDFINHRRTAESSARGKHLGGDEMRRSVDRPRAQVTLSHTRKPLTDA